MDQVNWTLFSNIDIDNIYEPLHSNIFKNVNVRYEHIINSNIIYTTKKIKLSQEFMAYKPDNNVNVILGKINSYYKQNNNLFKINTPRKPLQDKKFKPEEKRYKTNIVFDNNFTLSNQMMDDPNKPAPINNIPIKPPIKLDSSGAKEYKLSNKLNIITNFEGLMCVLDYQLEPRQIYSISITGFYIKNNQAGNVKIFIKLGNGDIKKVKGSKLIQNVYNNVNYIETKSYGNIKNILISSKNNIKFGFEKLQINKKPLEAIKEEAHTLDILNVPKVSIYKKNLNRRYNVAYILDDFSYKCFNYELNLIEITQTNWKNVIDTGNIDFLLVESAWHGNRGNWEAELVCYEPHNNKEINKLLNYVNIKKIKKVFYNKEDPISFNLFLKFAKAFNGEKDLVVTTDSGMIQKYYDVGITNVIAVPFCCQPVLHNPCNKNITKEIIFPCSYYHKFPERCKLTNQMIDKYYDNIDIYDRQYMQTKQTKQLSDMIRFRGIYDFPKKYKDLVRGSLSYEQVLNLYKEYKCIMNINTVNDSETMFSRRVVESASSGIAIILGGSIGEKKIFGDSIVDFKNTEEVMKLLRDSTHRSHLADQLYKTAMKNFTYSKFVNKIEEIIFNTKIDNSHNVFVLLFANNPDNVDKFGKILSKYDHLIVNDNNIVNLNTLNVNYNYLIIMNENCHYDDEYIENMMLPFNYTDAQIIGKACYYYREEEESNLVSKHLEHKFTNRLNTNTLIIKLDINTKRLININIIENIKTYLNNLGTNTTLAYSADRFDFIDNDYKYHLIYKRDININNIFSYGQNYENENTIPIVMCCFKRVNLLKNTIDCLNKQKDKNFSLYIWNNSSFSESELTNVIRQHNQNLMYIVTLLISM